MPSSMEDGDVLEELHVRDLALIEEARLDLGPGMTVLTGETGAGKTALVSAVKLLVGERADSQMVRSGAAEAVVEGRVVHSGQEIVVRRRVSADGRSRCTLNGEMAAVSLLSEKMGPLFDLHGQHEHQALLVPGRHAGYLDRYIGREAEEALAGYRAAHGTHAAARKALEDLDAALEEDRRQADYLRFVLQEIDAVAPGQGEDEALEARLPGLRHGEKLAAAAAEAYERVKGEGGGSDSLAHAVAALDRVSGIDPGLDRLSARLAEAIAIADDAGSSIREYGEGIEHDPDALNVVEARLAALAALKKKYGGTLAQVDAARQDAAARLEALDGGSQGRAKARADLETAREELTSAGDVLAALRRHAEPAFVEELAARCAELGMRGARFGVSIDDVPFEEWSPAGPVRIEFLFAAGPDQPLRSLSRIASGGEISRVMLALKGVLGAADDVPVLIFDEVDAGIGGTTARAVGERLFELSRQHQVLVVTHLAQVAAFADRHLVVRKTTTSELVRTEVAAVAGRERVVEVARMLSGAESDTGLAHAEELLADATAVTDAGR